MIRTSTRLVIVSLVASLALSGGMAFAADLPDKIPEITAHLEFLGYKVQKREKALTAKHDKFVDLIVRKHRGGILLTGFFGASDFAKSHRTEFLEFINHLNAGAAVLRAYADKDGDLALEAWFPAQYERSRFGTFIEGWNSDIQNLLVQYKQDAQRFLK